MRPGFHGSVTGRAILGVIALYGLLLQSFFAAAAPSWASAPPGLCSPADHGSTDEAPAKPVRHDHQCCAAAHPGSLAPPPVAVTLVRWTVTAAAVAVPRRDLAPPKTGPPRLASGPRGPPTV